MTPRRLIASSRRPESEHHHLPRDLSTSPRTGPKEGRLPQGLGSRRKQMPECLDWQEATLGQLNGVNTRMIIPISRNVNPPLPDVIGTYTPTAPITPGDLFVSVVPAHTGHASEWRVTIAMGAQQFHGYFNPDDSRSRGELIRGVAARFGADADDLSFLHVDLAARADHYLKTGEAGSPKPGEAAPLAFTKLMSFGELLALDTRVEYLVDDVLVRGQPGVIAYRSKTLKTSIIIDLCLSLGSGTPFLGKWATKQSNVAFWSGESGAATIKAKALAAAVAKGIDAASVYWSFDLPKLSQDNHLAAMGEVITQRGIEVAVIDPLYLTLLDARTAGQASNVFTMGPALAPLTALGQATGCTILLAHHFRKTGASDPNEPASLEQLSQASVAEWVRQWMLLERRSPYQADGRHELYMRTGGSAGHAGLWALDVDEGARTDGHQDNWRHWDAEVRPISDVRGEAKRAKDDRKAERARQRDDEDRRKMLDTLRNCLEGDTIHALRELARLSTERASTAIRTLVGDGHAEMFKQRKHTREETFYRAVET